AAALRAGRLGRVVVAGRMAPATRQRLEQQGAIVRDGLHGAETVRDVFSACDGALVLSKEENLPFVVIEALACGCPVFGRRIGGIGDRHRAGRRARLLAATAGAEESLGALRGLAVDPAAQRLAHRRACRAHAKATYAINAMLHAYESVYVEMMRGAGA